MSARFSELCRLNPLGLQPKENTASSAAIGNLSCTGCDQDIFLGFFFDGTNNNKYYATESFSHSNIARLYETYPGYPVAASLKPGKEVKQLKSGRLTPDAAPDWPRAINPIERNYYRKTYIPGVGTPFMELGDSGEALQNIRGEGMAAYGEVRIDWALLQISNHIHQAILVKALPSSPLEGDAKLAQQMTDSASAVAVDLARKHPLGAIILKKQIDRYKLLKQREAELAPLIAPFLADKVQGKPKFKRVRLAVFGFSRGAAQARVFVNWLRKAYGGNIAGLELKIDFLGLFDTVASVGIAQSMPLNDGHYAWASTENLRVSADIRCVHLVSAHEVRGSFPLDAIGGGALHKEVMYPGVHSDLGGGYEPEEQGRSAGAGLSGDSKKLSQIPLAQMYREALIAGVPLIPSSELRAIRGNNFQIAPQTIAIFNQYIEKTRKSKIKPPGGIWLTETQASETLPALRRRHYGQFLAWRKKNMGKIHLKAELQQSNYKFKSRDIQDFIETDQQLKKEIEMLNQNKGITLSRILTSGAFRLVNDFAQKEKIQQWNQSLKYIWANEELIPEAEPLFEKLVHDSRAWFRPIPGPDGGFHEPYGWWGYLRWRKIYLPDGKEAPEAKETIDDSDHIQEREKAKRQQLENERIMHEGRMSSLDGQQAGAVKQQQQGKDMSEFFTINRQLRQEELLRHQQAIKDIQGT